jgi:hypothetical protein
MQASTASRAVAAAKAIATSLELAADDAVVLHDSNKLTLRLLPGDVVARVALAAEQVAQFEIDLARQLALTGSPVAALDPRVRPRIYERGGFVVTLWTYYEPATPGSPAAYADALKRLHQGMRAIEMPTPHFTDRVKDAQRLLADRDRSPDLTDADRELLVATLLRVPGGGPEQLLHGEPHPGNVLATPGGPLFVDLETCCRGPVEFDLAHAPDEVADHYPGVDRKRLGDCRILMLAMIITWRWDRHDQLPNGSRLAEEWMGQLKVSLRGAWPGVRLARP